MNLDNIGEIRFNGINIGTIKFNGNVLFNIPNEEESGDTYLDFFVIKTNNNGRFAIFDCDANLVGSVYGNDWRGSVTSACGYGFFGGTDDALHQFGYVNGEIQEINVNNSLKYALVGSPNPWDTTFYLYSEDSLHSIDINTLNIIHWTTQIVDGYLDPGTDLVYMAFNDHGGYVNWSGSQNIIHFRTDGGPLAGLNHTNYSSYDSYINRGLLATNDHVFTSGYSNRMLLKEYGYIVSPDASTDNPETVGLHFEKIFNDHSGESFYMDINDDFIIRNGKLFSREDFSYIKEAGGKNLRCSFFINNRRNKNGYDIFYGDQHDAYFYNSKTGEITENIMDKFNLNVSWAMCYKITLKVL